MITRSRTHTHICKQLHLIVTGKHVHEPFSGCADIEELTRKTGNFKQFQVFVTMLNSAINKVVSTL